MDNQTRNRLNLQKHAEDQAAIIRLRNAQIAALQAEKGRLQRALQERPDTPSEALIERAERAEGDLARYRAMHSEQIRTIVRLQENPRPLTTDEIEAVLHDILPLTTARLGDEDIAEIAFNLHAALTEPTRPEGAAELDPIVDRSIRGCDDITSPETVRLIANGLAEEGVRAKGDQS